MDAIFPLDAAVGDGVGVESEESDGVPTFASPSLSLNTQETNHVYIGTKINLLHSGYIAHVFSFAASVPTRFRGDLYAQSPFDSFALRMPVPIQPGTNSTFPPSKSSVSSDSLRNNESCNIIGVVCAVSRVSHTKGVG